MNYDPNNILNSEETNFVKLSVYQSLEAENARLKAEVERLDGLCKQLSRQQSDISCENVTLRRAGDAMLPFIGDYMGWRLVVKNWEAAKEGKPRA
jgi:hypothetical protein